jgi:hypothetical protein
MRGVQSLQLPKHSLSAVLDGTRGKRRGLDLTLRGHGRLQVAAGCLGGRTCARSSPVTSRARRAKTPGDRFQSSEGQPTLQAGPFRSVTLPAFSLPSFAGGIAGITSGLPLGFLDRLIHNDLVRARVPELREQCKKIIEDAEALAFS